MRLAIVCEAEVGCIRGQCDPSRIKNSTACRYTDVKEGST